MDPDTTLAAIRELLVYIDDPDTYRPEDLATQLNELIERIDALDTWLVNGGHLPTSWQAHHNNGGDEGDV